MNFNYELITQPNTVVHCRTEEQAKELLEWAHENGMKWAGEVSLYTPLYSEYSEDTCYDFNGGVCVEFSPIAYFHRNGYKILSYEEALKENTMEEIEFPVKKVWEDGMFAVEFTDYAIGTVLWCTDGTYEEGEYRDYWFPCTDNHWKQYEEPTNTTEDTKSGANDGGKNDFYAIPDWVEDVDTLSEYLELDGYEFNILKTLWYRKGNRHDGTNPKREAKKCLHYANRRMEKIERKETK